MRTARKLALVCALAAAVAAAAGGIAEPGRAASEEVEVRFDSSFMPKTLPRGRSVPIALSLWGRIQAKEHSHPPALLEFGVDGESLGFSLGNRPRCHLPGGGPRLDVAAVRKACRSAILGTGRIEVEVEFPEQHPVTAASELLVLNGDTGNGAAPFIFGYLPAPVTGQVLMPLKVKQARNGRRGIGAHAVIPSIADGYGSVTYLRLDFKRGVFRAGCPHGTLDMSISGTFANNTGIATFIGNRCAKRRSRAQVAS